MSTQIPPPLDPRHGRLVCNVYEVNSRTGLCRWCEGTVEEHTSDTFDKAGLGIVPRARERRSDRG